MLLLVGLGNPGSEYAENRHNIGFMAADAIHRRHGFSPWRARFSAALAEGHLGTEKAILLKPQTFMNLSGHAVGEAMRFHKLSPADILVIHDEIDLPAGKLRMKSGGGHGGHNGLRSISQHIGEDYRRLRLGIGHPGDKALVHNHVLKDFAKSDREWLEPLLAAIADNAPLLAKGEDANFANRVSLAIRPEKAAPKAGKKADEEAPSKSGEVTPPAAAGPLADGPLAQLKKLFGVQNG